jgi:hypothetical protein
VNQSLVQNPTLREAVVSLGKCCIPLRTENEGERVQSVRRRSGRLRTEDKDGKMLSTLSICPIPLTFVVVLIVLRETGSLVYFANASSKLKWDDGSIIVSPAQRRDDFDADPLLLVTRTLDHEIDHRVESSENEQVNILLFTRLATARVVCLLFVVEIPPRLTLDNLGGHLHVDAECASCYKTQSVGHCCSKTVKSIYTILLLLYSK